MKRDTVDMMHSGASFPSALMNLQLREEVPSALPPLEGVWLHWYRYGVRATAAGICSLLTPEKHLLDPTTLSGVDIQKLTASVTRYLSSLSLQEPHWERHPLYARLLRHDGQPGAAAEQRKALLSRRSLTHMGRASLDDLRAMDAVFQQREASRCQS